MWQSCARAWWYIKQDNNSVFLLRNGRCLILSTLREFEWSSKGWSKFTCTNTVSCSRVLVKSHNLKVFQKDLLEAVFEKSWSEKFHKKFTQNKLLLKFFLQLPHNPQLHVKRTLSQLFSHYFWEYCFVS